MPLTTLDKLSLLKCSFFLLKRDLNLLHQIFCQEAAAADRYEGDPEELCRLPQTQELAVVETLH